jgi:predicted transcriptional regulator
MMIRMIAASRAIEIDDPENFKAFSVRIEGRFDDPAAEAALLGRIALRHDREHAWISEQALRDWPQLKSEAWWQDGLTKMIAAVERFGWIDNANHSIRAHIERLP